MAVYQHWHGFWLIMALPGVKWGSGCVGMQGLGEGVALPSMNNMVAGHVPAAAKARALGMCFTGFHSGKGLCCIDPQYDLQFCCFFATSGTPHFEEHQLVAKAATAPSALAWVCNQVGEGVCVIQLVQVDIFP